jgi:hypothetical protein
LRGKGTGKLLAAMVQWRNLEPHGSWNVQSENSSAVFSAIKRLDDHMPQVEISHKNWYVNLLRSTAYNAAQRESVLVAFLQALENTSCAALIDG